MPVKREREKGCGVSAGVTSVTLLYGLEWLLFPHL